MENLLVEGSYPIVSRPRKYARPAPAPVGKLWVALCGRGGHGRHRCADRQRAGRDLRHRAHVQFDEGRAQAPSCANASKRAFSRCSDVALRGRSRPSGRRLLDRGETSATMAFGETVRIIARIMFAKVGSRGRESLLCALMRKVFVKRYVEGRLLCRTIILFSI